MIYNTKENPQKKSCIWQNNIILVPNHLSCITKVIYLTIIYLKFNHFFFRFLLFFIWSNKWRKFILLEQIFSPLLYSKNISYKIQRRILRYYVMDQRLEEFQLASTALMIFSCREAPAHAIIPRSSPCKYIPLEKSSRWPPASVTTPPASSMMTTPAAWSHIFSL